MKSRTLLFYFVSDKTRTTSWLHPLKRNPVKTGNRSVAGKKHDIVYKGELLVTGSDFLLLKTPVTRDIIIGFVTTISDCITQRNV